MAEEESRPGVLEYMFGISSGSGDEPEAAPEPTVWYDDEGGYGDSTHGSRLAQKEKDREDSLLSEDEYINRYRELNAQEGWRDKTEDEWERSGAEARGVSLDQYRSGLVWDSVASGKGLSERVSARAHEFRDLAERDAEKYWEDKNPWQEDLEKNLKTQIGQIASKQKMAGKSNRAYVRQGIQRAAREAERQMISYIVEARTEEARHAKVAYNQLLDAAAQQGESALVASEGLVSQWAMDRANASRQKMGAALSFFGTILSSLIMYGARASDERLKSVTGDTNETAYNYLDQMKTAKYNMSPAMESMGRGQGESGVMAQSLEGNDMGARSVVDMGGGIRGIDPDSGLRNTMVAQKEMHERLKHLDGRLGINREAGRG